MPTEKEFKINEYLSLKLENNETEIYVAGKQFMACTFLLLNIPITEISTFDDLNSIDEIADKLDNSMESLAEEKRAELIPPEAEFWGHCSNLQVWFENNYDTCLLRCNLAFPLLKALTDAGDPLAKRVFKEEIAKRYDSGYPSVVNYLIEERFHEYLTRDELYSVLLTPEESAIIQQLDHYLIETVAPEFAKRIKFFINGRSVTREEIPLKEAQNRISLHLVQDIPNIAKILKLNLKDMKEQKPDPFAMIDQLPINAFSVLNKHVIKLKISRFPEGVEIPEFLAELKNLEYLYLKTNSLKKLPKFLFSLKNLKALTIYDESLFRSLGIEKIKTIVEQLKNKGIDIWI